jgi:hypothetical protein
MRHLKKDLWPHCVDIDYEYGDGKLTTIVPWLDETVGKRTERWYVVYRARTARYYFREEKDAAFFALRWQ